MFADAASPALPGKSPKHGGDPRFLPGGGEGAAAAGKAGAAGAAEGLVKVAGAGRKLPRATCGEVSAEEAAVVCGAGRTAGTG